MRNPTHIDFISPFFTTTVSVFLHFPDAYCLSSLVFPLRRWLPFYKEKIETITRWLAQPLPPDPLTPQKFPPSTLPPVVTEEISPSNPRFTPLPVLWIPTPPILQESSVYGDVTCFPLRFQPLLLNWLFLWGSKSAHFSPILKKTKSLNPTSPSW